jgi:hypothetical protein
MPLLLPPIHLMDLELPRPNRLVSVACTRGRSGPQGDRCLAACRARLGVRGQATGSDARRRGCGDSGGEHVSAPPISSMGMDEFLVGG